QGLQQLVGKYRDGLDKVDAVLVKTVPASDLKEMEEHRSELENQGLPAELARKLASHRFLQRALDIVKIADTSDTSIE
ncbi:NAD-glutamate dehydrogenase domain-containing protein, partial [Vibrio cholerae]|uniref:NAD-glutamate dehydrogenase domain-containing protein n=1 Tax=Vibrio cholerae TaxID=666 RepID=UPI00159FC53A